MLYVTERHFLLLTVCCKMSVCGPRAQIQTDRYQNLSAGRFRSVHTPLNPSPPYTRIHTQMVKPHIPLHSGKNSMLSIEPSTTCSDTHTSNRSHIDHPVSPQRSSMCHICSNLASIKSRIKTIYSITRNPGHVMDGRMDGWVKQFSHKVNLSS